MRTATGRSGTGTGHVDYGRHQPGGDQIAHAFGQGASEHDNGRRYAA